MFSYTLNGVDIYVTGKYMPPSRGYRDSLGVPEEPDEPADFEIYTVVDDEDNPVELDEKEAEQVIAAAIEYYESRIYDEC